MTLRTLKRKRLRKRQRALYGNVDCHLCGLPIPLDIVKQTHPLFGTIDHVVPRSLGGLDTADNRKPAHRICNSLRGVEDITEDLKVACFHAAMVAFHRFAIPQTKRFNSVRQLLAAQAHAEKKGEIANAARTSE